MHPQASETQQTNSKAIFPDGHPDEQIGETIPSRKDEKEPQDRHNNRVITTYDSTTSDNHQQERKTTQQE